MNLYAVLCPVCGRSFNPTAIGHTCPVCGPRDEVHGEPKIEWRTAGELYAKSLWLGPTGDGEAA